MYFMASISLLVIHIPTHIPTKPNWLKDLEEELNTIIRINHHVNFISSMAFCQPFCMLCPYDSQMIYKLSFRFLVLCSTLK